MMGDAFWTQKTTPHEWLQKVKNDKTWQNRKANLETAFAENPAKARTYFAESQKKHLVSDLIVGYREDHSDILELLEAVWDDSLDLSEPMLRLNVVGLLSEEWLKAFDGQKVVEEVPVLRTERANELWEIAKAHGWVDDNLMPTDSDGKAAILASIMAEVLDMPAPIWSQFENFWNKKSLSVALSKAKDRSYFPSLYKEIERAFK